jgi:hypothetical protein
LLLGDAQQLVDAIHQALLDLRGALQVLHQQLALDGAGILAQLLHRLGARGQPGLQHLHLGADFEHPVAGHLGVERDAVAVGPLQLVGPDPQPALPGPPDAGVVAPARGHYG